MRELAATGFLSNRLRQNVASFFVLSLGMDWRLGAAYFESVLIDSDTESNYGNWQYVAGVGNDPRGMLLIHIDVFLLCLFLLLTKKLESRKFNMIKQAKDYDPSGEYVRRWVPELAHLPAGDIGLFMPWTLSEPPKNYPAPIVVEREWLKFGTGGDRREPRQSDWRVKRYGNNKSDRNNHQNNKRDK